MRVGAVCVLLVLTGCGNGEFGGAPAPGRIPEGGNSRGSGDSGAQSPYVLPKFPIPADQNRDEEFRKLLPSGGDTGEIIFG